MDEDELQSLIASMRQIGSDTQTCEVKESVSKIPKTLVETLSAFSNGDGGVIVLGVSERNGFTVAPDFNARKMRDALISQCNKLTPVVRPNVTILPLDGSQVVCAEIPEIQPKDKPCFITERGRYQGSFIRTGDGDMRLSNYEIDRLLEEQTQPNFDDDIVENATTKDLDKKLVTGFIDRQRELHPRILGAKSDETILLDLHVLRKDTSGRVHPTLAGLLALGEFPQKFFPRLNVTFTAFPGTTKTERTSDGRRFLDTQTIIGPIPAMVADTLAAVARNSRTGAVIEGAFRKDVADYPAGAVREAISNALMHRDYSPDSRGSQVQVNLYADRLEILNPGGLFGAVTIRTLGKEGVSASRNQWLSNILETTPYPGGGYVVENRGTGYREIEDQLQQAFMAPPRPKDSIAYFSLTMDKRRITAEEARPDSGTDVEHAIRQMLQTHQSVSARELKEASGLSKTTINNHLRALIKQKVIEPTEPARSPKQRYRLAGHE
ncbi:putative DNA binding domain-containing protein [Bifidobacterium sp. ESL0728]|uniref:ATP-binding protein n=1 Tax=Bifidobacterium sp. ESL0728 TaxID=2983220 RepID=UPI0023F643CA|nr:ATP-binding protein [Bifidobacterium sp. ESL0728]WEV58928.1 putative DNA binding domain-containing protein [Bifidobacterium sp. ESL0728]